MTGSDIFDSLNPNSLETVNDAKPEPSLARAKPGARFEFERVGYFCVDFDSAKGKLVFNRTLPHKDTGTKIEKNASS
jgi:glutaminyl-tRNA synthetase